MKKILIVMLSFLVIFSLEVNADIDFEKNYKYYEQICSKRSSYELNRSACEDFKIYQENSNDVEKMEDSLNDSKLNAFKLAELISKNNDIIEKKEKAIKKNKRLIKDRNEKIERLEEEVINSLESMQYFSNENQIIDIIMASTNLDDLMLTIDGLSQINRANIENIYSLEKETNELKDNARYLEDDVEKLEKTKKRQEKLLREFRRKEANIYTGMNSGGNASINPQIDSVDLDKINDTSKSWRRPMKSGNVSAGTWYYPGGGWHPGMDIANKVGTNIIAPANGVLLASSNSAGGYGKHIVVVMKKNDYVYTMLFAHLSDFVGINEFDRGDTIAISGNTGASTGPHVHIEVLQHNTGDVGKVVSQFKNNKDYWFGLGYSGKGDCNKVCRLQPEKVFNLSVGQNF